MSWFSRTLKIIASAVILFSANPVISEAAVFVYEVVTEQTTFHTVSKLPPDAFLMYNGGEDIVYKLTVLKIYDDKGFNQAIKDYNLENRNVRYLPHNPEPRDIKRRPNYWWR